MIGLVTAPPAIRTPAIRCEPGGGSHRRRVTVGRAQAGRPTRGPPCGKAPSGPMARVGNSLPPAARALRVLRPDHWLRFAELPDCMHCYSFSSSACSSVSQTRPLPGDKQNDLQPAQRIAASPCAGAGRGAAPRTAAAGSLAPSRATARRVGEGTVPGVAHWH